MDRPMVALVAFLAVGGAVVSTASADTVLLFAPGGDAADAARAGAALGVRRALEARHLAVIAPERGLDCDVLTPECRATVARGTGARWSALVLVWRATGFRPEARVEVVLGNADGESSGASRVVPADASAEALSRAAAAATREAWDGLDAASATTLEVVGATGAAVLVDNQPVGVVPFEGPLRPGRHRVRVRASGGRVLVDEAVTVEPGGAPIVLRAHDPRAEDAGGGRIAGPVVLMAAGLAGVMTAGVAAARPRCAEHVPEGYCRSRRELRTGPTIGVAAAGAAALLGGLVWAIRLRTRAGDTDVAITPGGLRIEGTF